MIRSTLVLCAAVFVILSGCSTQLGGVNISWAEPDEAALLQRLNDLFVRVGLDCREFSAEKQFGSCLGEAGSDGIQSVIYGVEEGEGYVSFPYESGHIPIFGSPGYDPEFRREISELVPQFVELGATSIEIINFPSTEVPPAKATISIDEFSIEMFN